MNFGRVQTTSAYEHYLQHVQQEFLIAELREAGESMINVCESITEEKAGTAYAEGKWTIKELIVHLIDSERVFCYRAMRFARNDRTELPGFDHESYVPESFANERKLVNILDEFAHIRSATIGMFRGMNEEQLARTGVANGCTAGVEELGFVIAGHQRHHTIVLHEKYLS